MKKLIALIIVIGFSFTVAWPAHARDTKHMLPIASAMQVSDAQEKLDGSIRFFFGKQKAPKVLAKLGSDISNRKTNAFGKSDEVACNWAFLSALIALEKRAQALGANAVVNIVSYYKRNEMSSPTEFECHAGGIMAGVALKGDFVKIGKK
ncbi:MAG: excinuclease ATPase subunit [Burkholderiales bacterium RIFCSPLOWO2_02_FULL_57_36]|nr:MAG: excinuclease ATPase subunit [Burkholderiales bacterium RIFCSPLOWO2_02_FULL_57_36]